VDTQKICVALPEVMIRLIGSVLYYCVYCSVFIISPVVGFVHVLPVCPWRRWWW
jgi:hypothetical protein